MQFSHFVDSFAADFFPCIQAGGLLIGHTVGKRGFKSHIF